MLPLLLPYCSPSDSACMNVCVCVCRRQASPEHGPPADGLNYSRRHLRLRSIQTSSVESGDKGLITMPVSTYQSSTHHSCAVKLC